MHGPDPMTPHPPAGVPRPLARNPSVVAGEYTCYDDPDGPEHFGAKCVLYHFPFVGDRLVIGRFCALARGVKFVMSGANHSTSGHSTYPFYIFGNGWEVVTPGPGYLPYKGDTVVGNDVWVGYDAPTMPGVKIGTGPSSPPGRSSPETCRRTRSSVATRP